VSKVRNATGYKLRLRNRKLNHRVRAASWWWNAHLVSQAKGRWGRRGRLYALLGTPEEGVELTAQQELVVRAVRDCEATMTHAIMAYEGSVRLLSFRGGDPLPWSAMVLARTAFEASLRLLWVLEPGLSEDELFARVGANIFESLEETVRGHEKVSTGGQLRSPLVATKSPHWWPGKVPALH